MSKGKILSLHPASSDPPSLSLLVLSSSSLPSSNLPAGAETVFQGHGESLDSSPHSPPSPPELENHLQAVFSSCDPCMAGLVPTGKLVEYLSSLMDLERWKVEELSRMLDHTGDNKCVDQQLFIRVGKDWVERVVAKEEDRLEVQMGQEKKSSEERDLRYQLDRLRVEHSDLVRTLAVTDELVNNLTIELEVSRKKEVSLASQLKNTAAVLQEMEELKLVIRRLEEQKDSLTVKQELLIMENDSMNKQVEDEREQLTSIKKVLEEMMAKEIIVQSDLAEKDFKIQEILQMMEITMLQLKTEILKNEKMESELELCRQQLEMTLSTVAVEGDSYDSQSSCQLLDTSVDDPVAEVTEQQMQSSTTLATTSPPTVTVDQEGLGSIMAEIEEVVVMDRLPSPICKKEVRQTEVEVERMKNRVLEIVKSKVGLENNIWLNYLEREIDVGIADVLEADELNLEEECTDVNDNCEVEEIPVAKMLMRR